MDAAPQLGETVQLKSGGPKMTGVNLTPKDNANNTKTGHVRCLWFNEKEAAFQWYDFIYSSLQNA